MAYETVQSGREVIECGETMLPLFYKRVELEGLHVVKKGEINGSWASTKLTHFDPEERNSMLLRHAGVATQTTVM